MARDEFIHKFEGRETLQGLLELSECPLSTEEVAEVMKQALADGRDAQEIIPELFEGPPRFPHPSVAKQLFQNLLGLWDLLAQGKPLPEHPVRPPRPKKEKPVPPPHFAAPGPDQAYLETSRRYLQLLDRKEQNRLQHAFENRQDALLSFLDEQALSDEAYACARYLLFELFSMLELGWPSGVGAVQPAALRRPLSAEQHSTVPSALLGYAEECLTGAEQNEVSPLSSLEGKAVRGLVKQGLWALWHARRPHEGE